MKDGFNRTEYENSLGLTNDEIAEFEKLYHQATSLTLFVEAGWAHRCHNQEDCLSMRAAQKALYDFEVRHNIIGKCPPSVAEAEYECCI